jgi:hypothetical protein
MKIIIKIFHFTLDDTILDAGIREPDFDRLGLNVERINFLRFFRRVRVSFRERSIFLGIFRKMTCVS